MLKGIFDQATFACMSGTLTKTQITNIPKALNFDTNYKSITESPDRSNIFLTVHKKIQTSDSLSMYENIYKKEGRSLKFNPANYPITLLFIPMYYMSCAMMFLKSLFGAQNISESPHSCLYSNQDQEVIDTTLKVLNSENPRIKLVLTTSVSGMGFDPPCITRVIHACPPRSLSQYMQEIGRGGRRGQSASAVLYYSNMDLAKNLPGLNEDIVNYCNTKTCLRDTMLSVFGFVKAPIDPASCCSNCSKP